MNWLAASVKSRPQNPSNSKALEIQIGFQPPRTVKSCNWITRAMHTAWQLCFDLWGKIWREFVRLKQKDKNLLSVRSRQKAENESWRLLFLPLPISCCPDWSGECQQLGFHVFVKMLNEAELVCFLLVLLQPVALRRLGSRHGHGENKDFKKNLCRIWDKIRFR